MDDMGHGDIEPYGMTGIPTSNPGEAYDVQLLYPEMVHKLRQIAAEAREDLGDDLTNQTGKDRRPTAEVSK